MVSQHAQIHLIYETTSEAGEKIMQIDSHQHFWQYSSADYSWITDELAPLQNDFMPADLASQMESVKISGTIAVQARQQQTETDFLLQLANSYDWIKGVVGWIDLRSKDVMNSLEKYADQAKCRGFRHILQDEPNDNFMLGSDFVHGIGQLQQFDFTYDLLIFPRQLKASTDLARQFPEQPFVVDHIAKPLIADRTLEPWATDIRKLAECQNVCCKVSGMVTEAKWNQWQPEDFTPYLDLVFDCFGPGRILFGSDWPVCTLSGSYRAIYDLVSNYIRRFSTAEQEAIMGRNAAEFYRL